jgi:hypothetical protein
MVKRFVTGGVPWKNQDIALTGCGCAPAPVIQTPAATMVKHFQNIAHLLWDRDSL